MRSLLVLPIIILFACEPGGSTPPQDLPRLAPDHFPDGLPDLYDTAEAGDLCDDTALYLLSKRGRVWAHEDSWVLEVVTTYDATAHGMATGVEPCQLVMSGYPMLEFSEVHISVDVQLTTDLQASTCEGQLPLQALDLEVVIGPSGSVEWRASGEHWAYGFASGWEISFEDEPLCL